MDFNDYSVAIAPGGSVFLPFCWLCDTLHSPIAKIRIYKHRRVTKINKKKVKSKRRTVKQSRKRNR